MRWRGIKSRLTVDDEGAAKLDPRAYLDGVLRRLDELRDAGHLESVTDVVASTQWHPLVSALDSSHEPMTGVLTWADTRAAVDPMPALPDPASSHRRTGTWIHLQYWSCKAPWLLRRLGGTPALSLACLSTCTRPCSARPAHPSRRHRGRVCSTGRRTSGTTTPSSECGSREIFCRQSCPTTGPEPRNSPGTSAGPNSLGRAGIHRSATEPRPTSARAASTHPESRSRWERPPPVRVVQTRRRSGRRSSGIVALPGRSGIGWSAVSRPSAGGGLLASKETLQLPEAEDGGDAAGLATYRDRLQRPDRAAVPRGTSGSSASAPRPVESSPGCLSGTSPVEIVAATIESMCFEIASGLEALVGLLEDSGHGNEFDTSLAVVARWRTRRSGSDDSRRRSARR